MNINVNADKIIQEAKNPWAWVLAILTALAVAFAYLFHTERIRTTVNCDEEIKTIRQQFIDYQIQCNDDLLKVREECRMKIDSIEDNYYRKYKTQENQINKLEDEINHIRDKIK